LLIASQILFDPDGIYSQKYIITTVQTHTFVGYKR